MTDQELQQLAREYADIILDPIEIDGSIPTILTIRKESAKTTFAEMYVPFLRWLTKTHCIVSKKHMKEMYDCYLQNEQAARRLGLEHPTNIARGSTATMRDIFGIDIFKERKGMSNKVSKRQKMYIANKEAKCGSEISCAVCGKTFIKKQYSQAFCSLRCKDAYWNAKGDRHSDPDYYRRYNHSQSNAKERVGYAMLNSVVRIGTSANENRIIDDVVERVEQLFEERSEI